MLRNAMLCLDRDPKERAGEHERLWKSGDDGLWGERTLFERKLRFERGVVRSRSQLVGGSLLRHVGWFVLIQKILCNVL